MEIFAGVSEPQVIHLEQKDPYFHFSIPLFSFNGGTWVSLSSIRLLELPVPRLCRTRVPLLVLL